MERWKMPVCETRPVPVISLVDDDMRHRIRIDAGFLCTALVPESLKLVVNFDESIAPVCTQPRATSVAGPDGALLLIERDNPHE
jgi:hypothetical protein